MRCSRENVALLFLLLLLPFRLFAAELKVLDASKLLRASAECKTKCNILIQVDPAESNQDILITNIDGVQSDISATQHADGLQFSGVSGGTWLIQSAPSLKVRMVRIWTEP